MIPLILGLVGTYVVAEAYKKYVTPQQKIQWENFAKMHHGEAGAIMTVAGIVTKSPTLFGSGLGLMFHDKIDSHKWFKKTQTGL